MTQLKLVKGREVHNFEVGETWSGKPCPCGCERVFWSRGVEPEDSEARKSLGVVSAIHLDDGYITLDVY